MWRTRTLILWQCPFSWLPASSRYFCIHGLMLLAVTYCFSSWGRLAEVVTLAVKLPREGFPMEKLKMNGWIEHHSDSKRKLFICMLYEMAYLEYWAVGQWHVNTKQAVFGYQHGVLASFWRYSYFRCPMSRWHISTNELSFTIRVLVRFLLLCRDEHSSCVNLKSRGHLGNCWQVFWW